MNVLKNANPVNWQVKKRCIRKPAGKPGFVSALARGDGHFSSRAVARAVQRPTRES